MTPLKLKNGNALVIVAHPDDEAIWMGGVILAFPDLAWTIFSLCRKNDRDRSPKFKQVCKYFGAKAVISDLEDEGILKLKESLPEIEKRIRRELKQKRFTYIFTHGYNGEYGHARHKGVHQVLKNLIQQKKLSASQIYYFNYELKNNQKFATPKRKSKFFLKLPKEILRAKKHIIKNLYGFRESSFECLSSSSLETFNS